MEHLGLIFMMIPAFFFLKSTAAIYMSPIDCTRHPEKCGNTIINDIVASPELGNDVDLRRIPSFHTVAERRNRIREAAIKLRTMPKKRENLKHPRIDVFTNFIDLPSLKSPETNFVAIKSMDILSSIDNAELGIVMKKKNAAIIDKEDINENIKLSSFSNSNIKEVIRGIKSNGNLKTKSVISTTNTAEIDRNEVMNTDALDNQPTNQGAITNGNNKPNNDETPLETSMNLNEMIHDNGITDSPKLETTSYSTDKSQITVDVNSEGKTKTITNIGDDSIINHTLLGTNSKADEKGSVDRIASRPSENAKLKSAANRNTVQTSGGTSISTDIHLDKTGNSDSFEVNSNDGKSKDTEFATNPSNPSSAIKAESSNTAPQTLVRKKRMAVTGGVEAGGRMNLRGGSKGGRGLNGDGSPNRGTMMSSMSSGEESGGRVSNRESSSSSGGMSRGTPFSQFSSQGASSGRSSKGISSIRVIKIKSLDNLDDSEEVMNLNGMPSNRKGFRRFSSQSTPIIEMVRIGAPYSQTFQGGSKSGMMPSSMSSGETSGDTFSQYFYNKAPSRRMVAFNMASDGITGRQSVTNMTKCDINSGKGCSSQVFRNLYSPQMFSTGQQMSPMVMTSDSGPSSLLFSTRQFLIPIMTTSDGGISPQMITCDTISGEECSPQVGSTEQQVSPIRKPVSTEKQQSPVMMTSDGEPYSKIDSTGQQMSPSMKTCDTTSEGECSPKFLPSGQQISPFMTNSDGGSSPSVFPTLEQMEPLMKTSDGEPSGILSPGQQIIPRITPCDGISEECPPGAVPIGKQISPATTNLVGETSDNGPSPQGSTTGSQMSPIMKPSSAESSPQMDSTEKQMRPVMTNSDGRSSPYFTSSGEQMSPSTALCNSNTGVECLSEQLSPSKALCNSNTGVECLSGAVPKGQQIDPFLKTFEGDSFPQTFMTGEQMNPTITNLNRGSAPQTDSEEQQGTPIISTSDGKYSSPFFWSRQAMGPILLNSLITTDLGSTPQILLPGQPITTLEEGHASQFFPNGQQMIPIMTNSYGGYSSQFFPNGQQTIPMTNSDEGYSPQFFRNGQQAVPMINSDRGSSPQDASTGQQMIPMTNSDEGYSPQFFRNGQQTVPMVNSDRGSSPQDVSNGQQMIPMTNSDEGYSPQFFRNSQQTVPMVNSDRGSSPQDVSTGQQMSPITTTSGDSSPYIAPSSQEVSPIMTNSEGGSLPQVVPTEEQTSLINTDGSSSPQGSSTGQNMSPIINSDGVSSPQIASLEQEMEPMVLNSGRGVSPQFVSIDGQMNPIKPTSDKESSQSITNGQQIRPIMTTSNDGASSQIASPEQQTSPVMTNSDGVPSTQDLSTGQNMIPMTGTSVGNSSPQMLSKDEQIAPTGQEMDSTMRNLEGGSGRGISQDFGSSGRGISQDFDGSGRGISQDFDGSGRRISQDFDGSGRGISQDFDSSDRSPMQFMSNRPRMTSETITTGGNSGGGFSKKRGKKLIVVIASKGKRSGSGLSSKVSSGEQQLGPGMTSGMRRNGEFSFEEDDDDDEDEDDTPEILNLVQKLTELTSDNESPNGDMLSEFPYGRNAGGSPTSSSNKRKFTDFGSGRNSEGGVSSIGRALSDFGQNSGGGESAGGMFSDFMTGKNLGTDDTSTSFAKGSEGGRRQIVYRRII